MMRKNGKTPTGKQRWICDRREGGQRADCYGTTNPTVPAVRDQRGNRHEGAAPKVFTRKLNSKTFVITAAQNATPVHAKFFTALKHYADVNDAELIVIPLRYKNPTSAWTASQENEESWSAETTPFLYNARKALNENVVLLADIKTQPTASSPLTGYEGLSHGESCVLGHTKLQMKVVPTPHHKFPKMMTTTGACTMPNYTDSKSGKLGEFHHTLGAVVVEVASPKTFHLRHLNGSKETGEFTDLGREYGPGYSKAGRRPLALIMGDTHVDFIDKQVEEATFGRGGIIEVMDPEVLVWHDLLDSYAVNPHHRGNPFISMAKRAHGRDNARDEVLRAIEFVNKHTSKTRQSVIVSSNHDDMLARWVRDTDWRNDPTNAEFYLRTALEMARRILLDNHGTSYPSPFGYWCGQWAKPGVKYLAGQSFALAGIELSMHGDLGPNGARGSAKNLRRIGVKSVIGHSHSPCIEEGCYQVGTSTALKLEYNLGPSGWLNTHCLLHANGKRQLITIINGEWRL
jgi:hypothetical protein